MESMQPPDVLLQSSTPRDGHREEQRVQLGSAIATVSEHKRETGLAALVASYINPSQAEKLRELGIEFFDTAGNVFLKQEGLHVFVSGRKAREPNTREPRRARAFNTTGSRLIFALLCNPGLEEKPYRQLATEAGISLGPSIG
jgi:hypothetical protein